MSANDFQKKKDLVLNETASVAVDVIGSAPSSYGISAAMAVSLGNAATEFNDALADHFSAIAASKSATSLKNQKRENLVKVLSEVGAIIYRTPSVTDDMILRAGYAVHDTHASPGTVDKPLSLQANPSADGSVKLTWNRNGNKGGTIFNVEYKTENGQWAFLASTTKAKITVTGFTPGIATWFRVRASRDTSYSLPSNEAPIYHASSPPSQLQVAA
ncbi:MAG TPA: fibronectin type III domain-containing protein [Fimbriimonadaceae bacterium]|nr:fibronectin type III domain-containing protein [Fimbriimonadaceae bacterium]